MSPLKPADCVILISKQVEKFKLLSLQKEVIKLLKLQL